ncbi:ras guanine nucleotide exchange factor a [Anaeramoeba flamelloides]|uniref:Ras guanine nucleotide exchange factor a n=1 Tax=Anaeramoeba flamelloides TaxID=1746091 RepID=A0AAV7ZMW3_9EUKA|nr:ras guanine nucleotide exchange factor a [Anaeramoeba flamelloides]
MSNNQRIKNGSKVSHQKNKAVVRYIGPTIISEGTWYGIEFKKKVGENNGTLGGKVYFKGKDGHCKFVLIGDLTRRRSHPKKSTNQKKKKKQVMGHSTLRNSHLIQLNKNQEHTHQKKNPKKKKSRSAIKKIQRKKPRATTTLGRSRPQDKTLVLDLKKRSKSQRRNSWHTKTISSFKGATLNYRNHRESNLNSLSDAKKKYSKKSLKKLKKILQSLESKLETSTQEKKGIEAEIFYYKQYTSKIFINKFNEEDEFDEEELLEIQKDEKEEEELQTLMKEIHKLKKKEEKIDQEEKQTQNEIQNFCMNLSKKSNLVVASKVILKQRTFIKSSVKYEELFEKKQMLTKEIQKLKTLINSSKKSHKIEIDDLKKKINFFDQEIVKSKERIKKFGDIESQSKLNIDELERTLQSLKIHMKIIKKKILDLELNKDKHISKMDTVLEYRDQIDRSHWNYKLNNNNPEIKDLRERINPLRRAVTFSNYYSGSKTLIEKQLTNQVINQLIMQHLEFENKKECKKVIEEVTSSQYHEIQLRNSRLRYLLRISIKEIENLWSLLMDKNSYSNILLEEKKDIFEEKIDELGLDLIDTDENDTNIWDEPPDNEKNIIYENLALKHNLEDLENDHNNEENILKKNKTNGKNDHQKDIYCANINKLVEKLTDKKTQVRFRDAFIMTYPSFMKPTHLLSKLKERYNVPIKLKAKYQNEKDWKNFRDQIQIKVISVLNGWIKNGWIDIDKKLLIRIIDFINTTISKDKEKSGEKLLKLINDMQTEKNNEKDQNKRMILDEKEKPPDAIIPKKLFNPNFTLINVPEEEFARQMTILIFDIYRKIKPSELITESWKPKKIKSKSPNIIAMIQKFNEYSNYIATLIVKPEKVKTRAKMFSRFLRIGKHLLEMNNYDSLMATLAAYTHSAVKRLKVTMKEVPKGVYKTLIEFKSILKRDKGFQGYRKMLNSIEPPIVPYLGVFLTDITVISNSSSDKIDGLINFNKRKLLYNVVWKLQQFQKTPFNFYPIHQIQILLRKRLPAKGEKELYKLSLKREPRN